MLGPGSPGRGPIWTSPTSPLCARALIPLCLSAAPVFSIGVTSFPFWLGLLISGGFKSAHASAHTISAFSRHQSILLGGYYLRFQASASSYKSRMRPRRLPPSVGWGALRRCDWTDIDWAMNGGRKRAARPRRAVRVARTSKALQVACDTIEPLQPSALRLRGLPYLARGRSKGSASKPSPRSP